MDVGLVGYEVFQVFRHRGVGVEGVVGGCAMIAQVECVDRA